MCFFGLNLHWGLQIRIEKKLLLGCCLEFGLHLHFHDSVSVTSLDHCSGFIVISLIFGLLDVLMSFVGLNWHSRWSLFGFQFPFHIVELLLIDC